jgi:hypothetical protein
MKTILGLILTLIGIAILVYGVGMALMQVVGMYDAALNHPLDDRPGESGIPGTMLRFVLIGCVGIPFLVAGKVLLIMAYRSRRRARRGI